jgi:dTDP-4-dehydrorhamnose reductase
MLEKACQPIFADVRDIVALDAEVKEMQPDVIIHLAGESDVKKCEEGNRKGLSITNFQGSINVFDIAEKYGSKVVFLSSDHVFSGNWLGNYKETSQDLKPKNFYGSMKLSVEGAARGYDNVYIVRTSTLFYRERPMVDLHLRQIANGHEVHLPLFLWRSFMHVEDFATSLLFYSATLKDMPKILHISGDETVSWYKFIRDYAEKLDMDYNLVKPRLTQVADVPRPMRAGLNTSLARDLGVCNYYYKESM